MLNQQPDGQEIVMHRDGHGVRREDNYVLDSCRVENRPIERRVAAIVIVLGPFVAVVGLTAGLVFMTQRVYPRLEQLEEC